MYKVYLDQQLIHDLDSEDNVLVNPTLSLELNKASTFEFAMEPTHPMYDSLKRFKSIVQVLQDNDEIFKGRVIEVSDDMYKERTVYCESELAYLNDSIQRPYEYQLASQPVRRYLESVIAEHNEQVDSNLQFTVGIVDVEDPNNYLYCYTNYETTMECIKEDLVDDYGGYIRVRNVYTNNNPLGTLRYRYIDYIPLDEYGSRSTQYIEFGENLLDFTSDIDQTDICTGIIPLGATLEESQFDAIDERLTIKSVNKDVDYIYIPEAVEKYGLILKTVTWDDITVASNLLTAAQNYLANMAYDDMTITATAVDMHLTNVQIAAWRLGDMIRVISKPHDLDKWFPLASMSIPLDAPENTSVTLGTFEDVSLTARTNEVRSGLRDFEDFTVGNVIASAVAQATALIQGATHGYVTLNLDEDGHPFELLILDQPEIDQAKKIWRWNMGGLGYTDGGYEKGDYALAMTMDGHILGTLLIANGAILADDRDVEFAKFDDSGMKIYAQSGRSDLLLMSIGREGLTLYNDSGKSMLASFYSDGVKVYNSSETVLMTLNANGLRIYNSSGALRSSLDSNSFDVYDSSENLLMTMDTSGAHYYYNGNLVGNVGTSYWTGYPNNRGLAFNLEYGAAFMTFGWRQSSSASTYTAMIAYHTSSSSEAQGVHFGDNVLLNNYPLYLGTSTSGAYLQAESGGGLIINGGALYIQQTGYYNGYEIADQQWVLEQIPDLSGIQSDISNLSSDVGNLSSNVSGLQSDISNINSELSNYVQQSASAPITIKTSSASASGNFSFSGGAEIDISELVGGGGGDDITCNTLTASGFITASGLFLSSPTLKFESGLQISVGDCAVLWGTEDSIHLGAIDVTINIGVDSSNTVYIMGKQYSSSDKRLKTSIQPLNTSSLDNLTPVSFKWRDGDDKAHYGYIAQEVQPYFPELVSEGTDGMLGLAYTEIIPLLHCKIKEQQATIESLEERIAKLEAIIYGKEESD